MVLSVTLENRPAYKNWCSSVFVGRFLLIIYIRIRDLPTRLLIFRIFVGRFQMFFIISAPQPTYKILGFGFFVGRFDQICPVKSEKPAYKNRCFSILVGSTHKLRENNRFMGTAKTAIVRSVSWCSGSIIFPALLLNPEFSSFALFCPIKSDGIRSLFVIIVKVYWEIYGKIGKVSA